MKKIIFISIALIIGAIVTYRVIDISAENSREIFNAARVAQTAGVPVDTMTAEIKTDMLREPIVVKNGKAFVSGARLNRFKINQRLICVDERTAGRIISVSRNIDLNTGLFAVKTSSPNGNFFTEIEYTGVFLPLSAVSDSVVMVSENGIATPKTVKIIATDTDRVVVNSLEGGEIVILTKVEVGTKVKVNQGQL